MPYRILWTCLLLVLSWAAAAAEPASGTTDVERQVVVVNPATDLWRAVRQREGPVTGTTQARNVSAGQLINPRGQEWREFRRQYLIPIGGLVLAAAAGVVILLFIFRPSIPFAGGPSNRWLERFNVARRVGHWVMTLAMLILAITGLILLFGRYGLLPWMSSDGFGTLAGLAKQSHDLTGPVFVAALLVFFFQFVARNLPARGDLGWLLRLGGLFSKGHLPAGFFNAGEKVLFWLVVLFGGALSASGLLLLLQNLEPSRFLQQAALLIHAIAAVGLTALVLGHIYMALSIRGALQGMLNGRVDANWAKEHHRRWFDEAEAQGLVHQGSATGKPQPPAAPAAEPGVSGRA